MSVYFSILRDAVIQASEADDWQTAKEEWKLFDIYDVYGGVCICTHNITEHCVLKHKFSNKELIVGNHCVNHFSKEMGREGASLHRSLNRIRGDPDVSPSEDLIKLTERMNIVTPANIVFMRNIRCKRTLSEAQLKYRRDLNHKICKALTR